MSIEFCLIPNYLLGTCRGTNNSAGEHSKTPRIRTQIIENLFGSTFRFRIPLHKNMFRQEFQSRPVLILSNKVKTKNLETSSLKLIYGFVKMDMHVLSC